MAEVALFSLDSVPSAHADAGTVAAMERDGSLVRFPTGADGGYLLHAYVDEPVPDAIARYCAKDDVIQGRLVASSGRIAFGGIESAFADFKPNPNIRSDASIPPGEYTLTAYHTEIPDELVEAAVIAEIGRRGEFLLSLPGYVILVGFIAAVAAHFFKGFLGALAVFALCAVGLKFGYFSNPAIRLLRERKHRASLQFPSIVVEMWSGRSPPTTGVVASTADGTDPLA